jgi:hypothetical protein
MGRKVVEAFVHAIQGLFGVVPLGENNKVKDNEAGREARFGGPWMA